MNRAHKKKLQNIFHPILGFHSLQHCQSASRFGSVYVRSSQLKQVLLIIIFSKRFFYLVFQSTELYKESKVGFCVVGWLGVGVGGCVNNK